MGQYSPIQCYRWLYRILLWIMRINSICMSMCKYLPDMGGYTWRKETETKRHCSKRILKLYLLSTSKKKKKHKKNRWGTSKTHQQQHVYLNGRDGTKKRVLIQNLLLPTTVSLKSFSPHSRMRNLSGNW